MAKSPDAFRTISEVADWLGLEAHVLRFWETKFAQVKPVKRAGGRRYYRATDMALLGGIRRLLHDEGMTIRGVQKVLREKGVSHVAALSPQLRLDMASPAAPAPVRGTKSTKPLPDARSPTRDNDHAPTLPFDLPSRAPQAAATHAGSNDAGGRERDRDSVRAPPTRLRVSAAQLDTVKAAELLSRAQALVDRLRNTPE